MRHQTAILAFLMLVTITVAARRQFSDITRSGRLLAKTNRPLASPALQWHHRPSSSKHQAGNNAQNPSYQAQPAGPSVTPAGSSGDNIPTLNGSPDEAPQDSTSGGSMDTSGGGVTGGSIEPPNGNSTDDSPTITSSNSTGSGATGTSVSSKKGCGLWEIADLDDKVQQLGCSWAYDWSPDPTNSFGGSAPLGVDLVAMIQKPGDVSGLASSSFKEIIGYNEPEVSSSLAGNVISAQEAASHWPELVATGKRIGSPAPAETKLEPGDWFYDFMTAIQHKGSHVDFICLHHYTSDPQNVNEIRDYIQKVYDMYKLPIWVTEWATIDYAKPGPGRKPGSVPDPSTQVTFMQEVVKMLDGLDYVERYAWFALPENDVQPDTYLFDSSGNISAMGAAYAAL